MLVYSWLRRMVEGGASNSCPPLWKLSFVAKGQHNRGKLDVVSRVIRQSGVCVAGAQVYIRQSVVRGGFPFPILPPSNRIDEGRSAISAERFADITICG